MEKVIRIKARVWMTQQKLEWHKFRVHTNGTIHVWHLEMWVQSHLTDLSLRQEQQIRYKCFGASTEVSSYSSVSLVPRLQKGQRFWIKGEPENDGLWQLEAYTSKGLRMRRILPNYYQTGKVGTRTTPRKDRIYSTPWTQEYHDCDSCFPTRLDGS